MDDETVGDCVVPVEAGAVTTMGVFTEFFKPALLVTVKVAL